MTNRPDFLGWQTDRVTLQLRIRVDSRLFTANGGLDGHVWSMTFKDHPEHWEEFLRHFIRQSVGALSEDPDQYQHFRDKLFVVTPDDVHDTRICRASYDDTGTRRTGVWPVCLEGIIQRNDPGLDYDHFWSNVKPAGSCTCRCHQRPRTRDQIPNPSRDWLDPFDDSETM